MEGSYGRVLVHSPLSYTCTFVRRPNTQTLQLYSVVGQKLLRNWVPRPQKHMDGPRGLSLTVFDPSYSTYSLRTRLEKGDKCYGSLCGDERLIDDCGCPAR